MNPITIQTLFENACAFPGDVRLNLGAAHQARRPRSARSVAAHAAHAGRHAP